jgi:hypothetical protein
MLKMFDLAAKALVLDHKAFYPWADDISSKVMSFLAY